jgi:hypothetical protein
MQVFDLSKSFPKEETYSLTDQIRRSSRLYVPIWRKRDESDVMKQLLSQSFQILKAKPRKRRWLEFAVKCNYLNRDAGAQLYPEYDEVIRMLVAMINSPQTWIIEST